ncbi:uncharacterized protein [Onthophagus taurus]|uniref:uncharacterized protein n=1 Tax=Onthophagus taurus TaxID=166361 RepID=UPI0039BDE8D9
MLVGTFLRSVGIVAGYLGLMQGLAWMIMSLLVILLRTEAWVPHNMNYFNRGAYYLFFQSESDPPAEDLIDFLYCNTSYFFFFAYFYFVASFLWIIASFFIIRLFFKHENYDWILLYTHIWNTITLVITALNLAHIIFFGTDWNKISKSPNIDEATKFLYSTVLGVAVTIMAGGYFLPIINMITAILLAGGSKKYVQQRIGDLLANEYIPE